MSPIAQATVRFRELSALWGADCISVSSTRTSADSVVDKLLVTSAGKVPGGLGAGSAVVEKEKEKAASEASQVVDTRRFFFPPRSQVPA